MRKLWAQAPNFRLMKRRRDGGGNKKLDEVHKNYWLHWWKLLKTSWRSAPCWLCCKSRYRFSFSFHHLISQCSLKWKALKGGVFSLAPPNMCPPMALISTSIESEQMAMVTEPIRSNNRTREDDEAGPDTRGMMQRWPNQTLKTDLLCLTLHEAAVDICCLWVGWDTAGCILTSKSDEDTGKLAISRLRCLSLLRSVVHVESSGCS